MTYKDCTDCVYFVSIFFKSGKVCDYCANDGERTEGECCCNDFMSLKRIQRRYQDTMAKIKYLQSMAMDTLDNKRYRDLKFKADADRFLLEAPYRFKEQIRTKYGNKIH